MAVERGAHVIRTHDVAETRDAAIVGDRFARERVRDPAAGVEELDVTTPGEAARHLDRTGAEADPAAAVARTFELDLDPAARETLADLVTDRPGVTVAGGSGGERTDAGVDAECSDEKGDERGTLLIGTIATLRGLIEEPAPELADQFAAVERGL
jgi:hypothetical protein